MKEVVFIKKFATKKKGDRGVYDTALVRTLINMKVAKLYVKDKK